MSNARLNGDSPKLVMGVVWKAYKMLGSSEGSLICAVPKQTFGTSVTLDVGDCILA